MRNENGEFIASAKRALKFGDIQIAVDGDSDTAYLDVSIEEAYGIIEDIKAQITLAQKALITSLEAQRECLQIRIKRLNERIEEESK